MIGSCAPMPRATRPAPPLPQDAGRVERDLEPSRDRRARHHGGLLRCDPDRWRTAQRPHPTCVGLRTTRPTGFEVLMRGEFQPGRKDRSRVVVEPFQHPHCLGASQLSDVHTGTQNAAEHLAFGGQLGSGARQPL